MTSRLLSNPDVWSPAQLEAWLKGYENGRFSPLAEQLRLVSGRDVIHFTKEQWERLHPSELATSLRFTILGMATVAQNSKEEAATEMTISTDYTLLAPTPSDGLSTVPTDLHSGRVSRLPKRLPPAKVKPVKFPPMIETPSLFVSIILIVSITVCVLSLTVLKTWFHDRGVTTEDLIRYGSIPFVCVVFTYLHIWLALYMTFYPLEYQGCLQIPDTNTGLGWQGIVPHKGATMARQAVKLMTTQLMQVKDVFSRIEPAQVVVELEPILPVIIREIVDDIAFKYSPKLWVMLSDDLKNEIIAKVKEETPVYIESLMDEIRTNIEDVFDIEDMVVTNLCKDKQLMVNMFVTCGYTELAFIRNSGAYMGGIFGLMQMGIWFVYPEPIVVFPLIGLVVGSITNYLALKMIFSPVNPIDLKCFKLQGLFLRRQEQVASVYGTLVARDILTSRNMLDSLIKGPCSDRLLDLVYENVTQAVDASVGATEKIINFGIGPDMYAQLKTDIIDRVVEKFPEGLRYIEAYADVAMDLERTLCEKMKQLSSEQFESLLHPIFQEDEWKLILMGGVLGVIIGIVQSIVIADRI